MKWGYPPFSSLSDVEFYRIDFRIYFGIVLSNDMQFLAFFQYGDFSVFEIDDAIGVFDDGRGVRCKEKFVFADAYRQWAALSCRNDCVGVSPVEYGNGIRSYDFVQSQLYSGEQVEIVRDLHILDKLYEDFGVGATFRKRTPSLCNFSLMVA